MTEIPSPHDTGSDGSQKISNEVISLKHQSPTDGLPITKMVEGLAATRSKNMGGDVAAGLIAGSFSQLSHELCEAKQEEKRIRANFEEISEKLSDCKQRAAVLEERVRSTAQNKNLRNLSITAGTALVGFAIEFKRNDLNNYSIITGGLGFLLILFGWLSSDGEVKK